MTPIAYVGLVLLSLAAGTAAILADWYLATLPEGIADDDSQAGDRIRLAGQAVPRVPREKRRIILVGAGAVTASALVSARLGWTAPLPACCCVCAAAAPLTAIDLAEHRLPDRITLPAIASTLILLSAASWHAHDPRALGRAILAAAVSAGFFLMIALITRALGAGDVKLAALTGLPLGWLGWDRVIVANLAGMTLAALTAGVLVVTRRISRHDAIPLGPFLLAGALLGLLL